MASVRVAPSIHHLLILGMAPVCGNLSGLEDSSHHRVSSGMLTVKIIHILEKMNQ